ncbi:MAG: response regulator transcription factor [Anaerolineales bacterium]|jgi:DNA-binding response OmpR family regulator|nr:response regulator transcription factor [Anaerolineales bacterium]
MPGELILLVDDEPNIIQLARLYLEKESFQVKFVSDGRAALQAIERERPALVVLDLMLPEIDGWEVCRRLRAQGNNIPILMLTARDEDVDKIVGLELGADDYLTKPFNPRELAARVKAILRRSASGARPEKTPIYIGDLMIDPASREATVKGKPIDLRTQEFDLLLTLVEHRGMVLTREKLLEKAWGYEYYGGTRTVDVHVGHLRRKLSGSDVHIETVTGVGYKLVV